MTKQELITIMKYFQTVYPGFYQGANQTQVADAWLDAFGEFDAKLVQLAAKNYVRINEYAPTIAGVMKQLNLINKTETDTDLWALIVKAASNGIYGAEEEFKKLPPECQSFVGSPSGLKELAQIDTGTLETVVKGQFLKRVEAIKQHQEVQRGLPSEVRRAIEESRMRMLEGEIYD